MHTPSLADAKARLSIYDLWRHFGFPGQPRKSCRAPWREDREASFSVYADGTLWHDFATGERGDAIDFLQRATGLSKGAACRKFIELAGGRVSLPNVRRESPPRRGKPNFPVLECGTGLDFEKLSAIRSIPVEGLLLASERGLLRFATIHGHRAWIITDGQWVNGQARRLDGMVWTHLEKPAKAYTLPGSCGGWTVGAKESKPFPNIALCEGGPDFLAAFSFIEIEKRMMDCTAVSVLGASNSIHADALPLFAGKRIRIFCHTDDSGRAATERWARQLEGGGADVDAFDFTGLRKMDGSPVNDLNDCTLINPDDLETNRELWGMLP